MFALYDILLILSAAAATSVGNFFFGRISTADCVLQVMLTQDWFMELSK
jgi:hypothetical protein